MSAAPSTIDLASQLAALIAAEEPVYFRIDPSNPPVRPCWIFNRGAKRREKAYGTGTWFHWGREVDHPIGNWDTEYNQLTHWAPDSRTKPDQKPPLDNPDE